MVFVEWFTHTILYFYSDIALRVVRKVPRQISSFMLPLHHTACSVTRFGVQALPNDFFLMATHSAVALLLKQADIVFTHYSVY